MYAAMLARAVASRSAQPDLKGLTNEFKHHGYLDFADANQWPQLHSMLKGTPCVKRVTQPRM
jgi:hypothetical protein